MEGEGLNQIIFSTNTIEFVTVAKGYCNLLENAENSTAKDLMWKTQRILPLLYFKASVLPEFESTEDMVLEKYVQEVDYHILIQQLVTLLGDNDISREEERLDSSNSPWTISISESLCDIYQDLKNFIMSFRTASDAIMQESLWQCIDSFKHYWGAVLLNVLKAIHNLNYSDIEWDNEEISSDSDSDSDSDKKYKTPDFMNKYFKNNQKG
ncbi:MAG: DUF5063 domain-containing protein [Prolixibacteraceae bacterium]|nr:DUF5063 domain-containing protein [Prolixibacteraceae bacterium]